MPCATPITQSWTASRWRSKWSVIAKSNWSKRRSSLHCTRSVLSLAFFRRSTHIHFRYFLNSYSSWQISISYQVRSNKIAHFLQIRMSLGQRKLLLSANSVLICFRISWLSASASYCPRVWWTRSKPSVMRPNMLQLSKRATKFSFYQIYSHIWQQTHQSSSGRTL